MSFAVHLKAVPNALIFSILTLKSATDLGYYQLEHVFKTKIVENHFSGALTKLFRLVCDCSNLWEIYVVLQC